MGRVGVGRRINHFCQKTGQEPGSNVKKASLNRGKI